ncbi:hypothetical protein EcWSU1_02413 [Enterobacter ludwigii]|uniref:Uncharacterized protein n=1 Tax=Enterobacter ludwigii TaxID=299767 RepID=G8LD25_9ENTR|nr:hypothetical protein EcWSU1_02413 [Enterobacter ludwigii]
MALCMTNISHRLHPLSHELGSLNENLIFNAIALLSAESDQFTHNTVAMDGLLC